MTKLSGKQIWASLALVSAVMLSAGCSSVNDGSSKSSKLSYQPKKRDNREVEHEIGGLSSRILEMLQVKGKVTEPGPYTAACPSGKGDAGDLRWVRHPWSIYGTDRKVLQEGVDNLLESLPKQGWKVVKRGPDMSRNRNLQILAVHLKTHTKLDVTWMKDPGGDRPLIAVTLYSRCFRDPSNTASGS